MVDSCAVELSWQAIDSGVILVQIVPIDVMSNTATAIPDTPLAFRMVYLVNASQHMASLADLNQ